MCTALRAGISKGCLSFIFFGSTNETLPNAQAFVLHGASKVTLPATQEKLLKLAVQAEQVIALLDPDVAGRQSRTILDSLLCGQLFHAFVPGLHATASNDIRCGSSTIALLHAFKHCKQGLTGSHHTAR